MKYNYVPKYGIHLSSEIKDYVNDITKIDAYKKVLTNYVETKVFSKIPDRAGILPQNLHNIITNALPKKIFKDLNKLATNSWKAEKKNYDEDEYHHTIVEYFEVQIANKIIDPLCKEKGYDVSYNVDFASDDLMRVWSDYEKFSASIIYFSKN